MTVTIVNVLHRHGNRKLLCFYELFLCPPCVSLFHPGVANYGLGAQYSIFTNGSSHKIGPMGGALFIGLGGALILEVSV